MASESKPDNEGERSEEQTENENQKKNLRKNTEKINHGTMKISTIGNYLLARKRIRCLLPSRKVPSPLSSLNIAKPISGKCGPS